MSGQSSPSHKPNPKAKANLTASLRTKTNSSLFSQHKEGIAVQNKTKYAVALQNESALAAAHRLKISYHKLLKYNDLQEGEPLLSFQYLYLEPKKSFFNEQEPVFFRVEQNETLYEISQFYGLKLGELRQRNGLREGEEVENGELILLNQRAVARPKIRQKEFNISAEERLQPIKVEEILTEKAAQNPKDSVSNNTYPDYIYQSQSGGKTPQVQINIPAQNEIKTNPNSPKASISIFGSPAIINKED